MKEKEGSRRAWKERLSGLRKGRREERVFALTEREARVRNTNTLLIPPDLSEFKEK